MSNLLAIIGRALKHMFSPATVWRALIGKPATTPPAPTPRAEDGHERRDVRAIPVILSGVALLVTVAVVSGIVWGLFTFLIDHPRADAPASPLAGQRQPSTAPRLETVPGSTLAETNRRSNAILGSYGWVDRAHGVVHIPIERAMELLVQRGLPTRATGALSSTATTEGQTTK